MSTRKEKFIHILFMVPITTVFAAFWIIPLAELAIVGGSGPDGLSAYTAVITNPRYLESLTMTVGLSLVVTLAALVISCISGLFLCRNEFTGKRLLVSMLTLPLAFPGVVVGFMVIMLAGRLGLIGQISEALTGERLVFAYSIFGLFVGYLYFSIPRVILTIMAAAEKLDVTSEEAARSLGASRWQVVRDIIIPGLMPAIISSGAICFATSMGAFGTAFTLATRINVLPMVIYTEFTLNANIVMAAALSMVLGLITWIALAVARSAAGNNVAAAG